MKKIIIIALLTIASLLLVACGTEKNSVDTFPNVDTEETTTLATGINYVAIDNMKFMPADITIKAGESIEFVNKDSVDHTITLENGDVEEYLQNGMSAKVNFNDKGEFGYFCRLHPEMRGIIIVE